VSTSKVNKPHKAKKHLPESHVTEVTPTNHKGKRKVQTPDTTNDERDPFSDPDCEPALGPQIATKKTISPAQSGTRPQGRPRKSILNDAAKRMKMK
jgi:hypothetical protein